MDYCKINRVDGAAGSDGNNVDVFGSGEGKFSLHPGIFAVNAGGAQQMPPVVIGRAAITDVVSRISKWYSATITVAKYSYIKRIGRKIPVFQ